MTKTPNRTSSELAVAELRMAQKKLAKALVHILGLGHTFNGNTLNRLIQEVGGIADKFEDPARNQLSAGVLMAGAGEIGDKTYPIDGSENV